MDSVNSLSLSGRHGHGDDSVDRISDLPDSILSHILSFLPTRDAVATHILSKRWTFVWTTFSNLDFRYPDHQSLKSNDFVDFVNYVLLLHKAAYLNRFSLTLETESVPSNVEARINSWIYAAVARNVHEIFVSAKNFKLPIQTQRVMLSCEGLQSLELNCNFCISSEIAVSLPRLETLRLRSIYSQGGNVQAFLKFLGCCPVLKYLFMDLYMDNLGAVVCTFEISSTSLRHLELYVHNKYPTARSAICHIKLIAPSLEYIKLEDQVSVISIPSSLNSLVEANIQLASLDALNRVRNCFDFAVKAFQSFNYAKVLTLSALVIRALSRATVKMSTEFKRLTRLEVTIDRNHWSSLQDFIKLSDGLEVLTIKKDRDMNDNYFYLNNSNWEQLDLVPACLSNSLRSVSIGDYYGHHEELEMVSYILKHGSVIQVMKICFDESISDFETKFEMVKKISKFHRKSPVCEVEFC